MTFIIHIDGQHFQCPAGETVLCAMKGKGQHYLPVGCCAGGCGVCKVKVLKGQYDTKVMSRAKVSVAEQQQGFALACRILPLSDLTLMTIEKFESGLQRLSE